MPIGNHARSSPDKPAYVMAATGKAVSYRELDAVSNRGANLFRKLGLKPGDGIALFAENHPQYHQVLWAAQRSGLYYTALSSRLTAEEVAYIVNDSGARVFIASRAVGDVAARLASANLIPKVTRRYMMDAPIAGYESWESAIAAMPPTPIADETEGLAMLYSSGTTGQPKGVKHKLSGAPFGSQMSPIAMLLSVLYQATPEMVYLSPAPLYHSAPLNFTMAVHRIGGTTIIMEHFDAEDALRLIEKYRVTHTQMVPTMMLRLLKLPEAVRAKYDHSSLKVVIHAAAPCPVAVKEQMIEWWGPRIYEYYAGTEGNGFCAINSQEWLAHKGSVGRALAGKVHILDDGKELAAGEAGTIFFEGGSEFEYHNDPEKTKSSRSAQGWSTLGDIGYLDAEGFLYLTDRKANMIISGGVNIYPQEAENLLATHPKVHDVAVFGVPNEEFGEEVKAVVQPVDMMEAGPELAAELIAYCRQHLSAIKCPRSIDFDAELPRHATGKLYKRLIKDRYWVGHSKRIAE